LLTGRSYFRRNVISIVTTVAVFGALAGLTDDALAISAPIHIAGTGGEGVFIRPEPNTSHPAVGWMAEGTSPDYNCFTYGQMIGNVNVWFSVNHNGVTGYYASYFDDSSYHSEAELTAKYGIPKCGAAAPTPAPPPAPSPSPAPSGGLVFTVFNAEGGIYYRSSPHWNDTPKTVGVGVYNGDQVELICGAFGDAVGPYNDTAWSYVHNVTRPNIGDGWVNEHFINDGAVADHFVAGEPMCGSNTPGASGSGSTPASEPAPPSGSSGSGSSPTGHSSDPCISRYPSGKQKTRHVFGGSETDYDRQSSLYHVCEGFGAPDAFHFTLTPTMQCALIAAAATYGGPIVNVGVSRGCDLVSIASALGSGNWLGAVSGKACGYFSDVFAGGVGLVAAGATSETGPGAVAVGVTTYKALAAGLKIVCGGVIGGVGTALGRKLEANHETHVALDVTRHGKCIGLKHIFGHWSWSAASCR